jgi:hypothetical protein
MNLSDPVVMLILVCATWASGVGLGGSVWLAATWRRPRPRLGRSGTQR